MTCDDINVWFSDNNINIQHLIMIHNIREQCKFRNKYSKNLCVWYFGNGNDEKTR